METMKAQVDELSIFVGLDGLAQAKHPPAAVVEELVTAVTAEAILRALQAERWEEELKLYRLLN
jgi:post-segregation antitoxin (ccd killing protein)